MWPSTNVGRKMHTLCRLHKSTVSARAEGETEGQERVRESERARESARERGEGIIGLRCV